MRSTRCAWKSIPSIAAVLLCIAVQPAGAAGDVDLRGGYTGAAEAGFVGGGWLGGVGDSGRWFVNPNLEYAFADQEDYLTLNGDVHYDWPQQGRRYTYWLGGGPALIRSDAGSGTEDTDMGLNLLTGVGARQGKFRPFVQGKLTLADDSQVALAAGVRF